MSTEPQEQTGHSPVADIDNNLSNPRHTPSTKPGFDLLRRPKEWWLNPEFLPILTSSLSERCIGEKLGVCSSYAGRLRKKACRLLNMPLIVGNRGSSRPRNWWQQPEPLAILTSHLPERELGLQLGIAAGYAGRLRKQACLLIGKPIQFSKGRGARAATWWQEPEVLQILTSGIAGRRITEKLGISSSQVSRLRKKAYALLNIPHSPQTRFRAEPRPLNWWQEPATLQILMSGLTYPQIAEKLGIPPTHAARLHILARAHLGLRYKRLHPASPSISHRPSNWWTEPEPLQILMSDLKLREIGAKLRISTPHAFQLRKRARALRTPSEEPLAA